MAKRQKLFTPQLLSPDGILSLILSALCALIAVGLLLGIFLL